MDNEFWFTLSLVVCSLLIKFHIFLFMVSWKIQDIKVKVLIGFWSYLVSYLAIYLKSLYIGLCFLLQFLKSSTLSSLLNSNTLNLNILRKDNIVCVSLVNANMCLNSIEESNVSNLRNYTSVLPFANMISYYQQ